MVDSFKGHIITTSCATASPESPGFLSVSSSVKCSSSTQGHHLAVSHWQVSGKLYEVEPQVFCWGGVLLEEVSQPVRWADCYLELTMPVLT